MDGVSCLHVTSCPEPVCRRVMGVSLVWEGGRVLGCGGTGWTTATPSCYSWSPRRPRAWRREPSLVARRAFGLLVVEEGLVHMVRGEGGGAGGRPGRLPGPPGVAAGPGKGHPAPLCLDSSWQYNW